jgi:hypothetical protein
VRLCELHDGETCAGEVQTDSFTRLIRLVNFIRV